MKRALVEDYQADAEPGVEMRDGRELDGAPTHIDQQTETTEPIAIVGMACRFPGAADLETFWQILMAGKDCTSECPPGAKIGRVGELYEDTAACLDACRFGAFLTDIDQFDAEFFRISPSEAEFLDPQQRMMLETSWRALENAGIDPESLRGSSASVYAGMSNNDYRYLILGGADTSQAAASLYTITGTSLNTAIGRVSYALGFEGPAMTLDTACSSSLVAIHQAVTALRRGETDIGLAGGVQLVLSGKLTELRANAGMLSPDGTCKTFDARANGYVRGEGCGILVLKRLADARADGDHIWALVASTAINQDGTSEGLTVPRGSAQKAVIKQALSRAGVPASQIDYLEAHGTGTPVGDPIEINAAAEVYGEGRDAETPLLIGSVKTNMGHLEPAAGVAGVIKAALALRMGVIPKHLNFETPNPAIDWGRLPVEVVSEARPWPVRQGKPRYAGINSFGFSGTNAHVLLQGYGDVAETGATLAHLEVGAGPERAIGTAPIDAASLEATEPNHTRRTKRILPISAKTPDALKEMAKRYQSWLRERLEASNRDGSDGRETLLDLCYTAGVGRGHFNYRSGLVCTGADSLMERLEAVQSSDASASAAGVQNLAFAYTGQGSQWFGMGKALYDSEPVFRRTIELCEGVILEDRNESLIARMFGSRDRLADLEDPTWVQPAIYALQCALTDLWASLGVRPQVVLGHSLGEIAAARTAGVWSLEDGLRFAAGRGRLMSQLPGPGAMAAVFFGESEAEEAVAEYNDQQGGVGISLAALNGAHQVLSGLQAELEHLLDELEGKGLRVRRLKKSPGYHSALVEPILDELAKLVETLEISPPCIDLVSNVTGELVPPNQKQDSDYWRVHARQGVAYRKSVQTLSAQGVDAALEIGPNSVLGPMAQLAWPEDSAQELRVFASLRMPREDRPELSDDGGFLECLSEAYTQGLDIDFRGLFTAEHRRKILIPGYAFQRRRHWVEATKRRSVASDHPLLGSRHETAKGDTLFENQVFVSDPGWLKEHRVFDHLLMPGAYFGSMAIASIGQAAGASVQEFQLHNPLVFEQADEDEPRLVQMSLDAPDSDGARSFEVFSKGGGEDQWTLHAVGSVSQSAEHLKPSASVDLSGLLENLVEIDINDYYQSKSAANIHLGPSFRTLKRIWAGDGQAIAEIKISGESAQGVEVPALILDGGFQVLSAARNSAGVGGSATYIPFGWERFSIYSAFPESVGCHAVLSERMSGGESQEVPEVVTGDLYFYDRDGCPLGEIIGFTVKRATRTALLSQLENPKDLLYQVVWRNIEHAASLRAAHPLPRLAAIESEVEPFFGHLRKQGVEPEERFDLLLDLERLAQAFVANAFHDRGLLEQNRGPIEADALMKAEGIEPAHAKLVQRMLRMLEEAELLEKSKQGGYLSTLKAGQPLPEFLRDAKRLSQEFLNKHPHGQVELSLLSRFGASLFELLTGEMDPLALLFPEEGLGAADLYRVAPVSIAGNSLLAEVIARIVRDLPAHRPLRIIEVGAGTGATTEIVFAELGGTRLEYTFTDISAGFFSEAEMRFEGNDLNIEYRALDIENDPAEQGFDLAHYDLVIAANVLHATRNLKETLTNCRSLLVPGGLLVALESLRGRAWQDLTFGFLDGWWRFEDDYRKQHALSGPETWHRALRDSGFDDSLVFGGENLHETSGPLGSGTIVARAPEQVALPAGTWIIEPDVGAVAVQLREALRACGQKVVFSCFAGALEGTPAKEWVDHAGLRELLESLPAETPLRGVIHLSALDGAGVDAGTQELAACIERVGASALSLVQGLMDSGVTPSHGTWFVTCGAQVLGQERSGELAGATLWGIGKVGALEAPHLAARMIDLDPNGGSIEALVNELLWPDDEDHIALREDSRWVARLVRDQGSASQLALPDFTPWRLSPGDEGTLKDIRLFPVASQTLEPRQVRVEVSATGLNFSDVLLALGAQTPGASLGLEFAGKIVELGSAVTEFHVGEPVLGMGFGTFGPEAITHADLVAKAPAHLTAGELATIPIVFTTAAMAFELGKLKAGDRVLIHAGAGGVGLAAIQLVQAAGAEVFATASRPKQDFLRSMGVAHVFDSRTLDFGEEILAATQGEGVDLVLNSLTSEGFIETSLKCLGNSGRFIEIGRLDILTPGEMSEVRPDVDYHILSLDELKRGAPETVGPTFRGLVERFASGELKPLVHTKWPILEAAEALQYMGSARHIGKIMLTLPPLVDGTLKQDRTYLITGGFGGIGCAVAEWLADRGAKHIVLNGRRAPDESARETVRELEGRGVNVEVRIADMTDLPAVDDLLRDIAESSPPLAGIVHSVGVLSDGSIPNQTWERFEEVLWPKILGAWHLHQGTKHLDLDLFMLFSSATGLLGNAGQANHAAANAFLDQLAAHRRSLGLAGQSIAWGAWASIGEAAEARERIAGQLESTGTGWIAPELGIKTLDHIISHDLLCPAAMSVDWSVFEQHRLKKKSPFFEELLAASESDAEAEDGASSLQLDDLRVCGVEERLKVLVPYLQEQLQSVLRLASAPSSSVGFFDLGMDSLMAVELRNRLIRVFEGEMTISRTAVFDFPTVDALAAHLADELGQDDAQVESRVEPSSGPQTSSQQSAIAVVGMACRFPGAEDVYSFWRNLESGVDSITSSRGEAGRFEGLVGDANAEEGFLRAGGYVNVLDQFDNKFFRIRPIEARMMDPRQRLLLETCWEALENAGIDPQTLRGGRVGVYVGLGASEYRDMVNAGGYADSFLGTSSGMTTGRIAYAFGFMGPAMSFDLACASSLVAIHEGAAALQRGEVDLALVGGANAILSPAIMRFHQEIGLLSGSGRCRAFDAEADGYVRGEGCGMLVLKRQDEAEASGDPIWSVIRSSAVNQNGASAGLTIPNGSAQEQVIRDAVARADVAPEELDYLEAHGTGLLLSDPIEVRAAAAVYARNRDPDRPLLLGSVKGNIGHLEWAAGIAGVIKVILAMHHRRLPPQLNYAAPNDQIEWDSLPLRINQSAQDWPHANGRAPLAAVSAFGMSGANAHLILEGSVPASDMSEADDSPGDAPELGRVRLLPISGMTPARVAGLAAKYGLWLRQVSEDTSLGGEALDDYLADMAWSAGVGRHHFEHRKGIVFRDFDELRETLKACAEEEGSVSAASPSQSTKIALCFSGPESDLFKLGKTLYDSEPVVRGMLDQCAGQYLASRQADLLSAMFNWQSPKGETCPEPWFYPAVYAIQVALASHWRILGIEASVVLGVGVGEVAAAQVSGAIGLKDGLELITRLADLQASDADESGPLSLDGISVEAPKMSLVSSSWAGAITSEQSVREGLASLRLNENSLSAGAWNRLAELGVDCLLEIGAGEHSAEAIREAWASVKRPEPMRLRVVDSRLSGDYGEAHAKLLAKLYEAGFDLCFEGLFAGESRRKVALPTYAFERRRFWFSDPV